MTGIYCVHLPMVHEIWKDDKTVQLVKCLRCHAVWKAGDAMPVVLVGEVREDDGVEVPHTDL